MTADRDHLQCIWTSHFIALSLMMHLWGLRNSFLNVSYLSSDVIFASSSMMRHICSTCKSNVAILEETSYIKLMYGNESNIINTEYFTIFHMILYICILFEARYILLWAHQHKLPLLCIYVIWIHKFLNQCGTRNLLYQCHVLLNEIHIAKEATVSLCFPSLQFRTQQLPIAEIVEAKRRIGG